MACDYNIQTVVPTSITVATNIATITLPTSFEPVNGGIYDISLAAPVPDGTNGAEIIITNGTVSGNLLNRLGSNVRMGPLDAQWILRVMYLEDPAHFNLINRRWRCIK